MKQIFKSTIPLLLLVLCSAGTFTSCEDDRDGNPILTQPASFVLNAPEQAAKGAIDVANVDSLTFSWQQPAYTASGADLVVSYQLEISATGSFTHSYDEALSDESGTLVADYATVEPTTKRTLKVSSDDFSKALQQAADFDESAMPATQDVYLRVIATINGAQPVYSNVQKVSVIPVYVQLSVAPVEMWYLIGDCIGDGKWGNSADQIGVSIYPMAVTPGYSYDKKTGQGVLTYTGYFPAGKGFKLIKTPGSWDSQWGMAADGSYSTSGDNITVKASGYYTLTLDTKAGTLAIAPSEATPKVFSAMYITGGFNGWADPGLGMTAVNTTADMQGHNHIWTTTLDASGAAVEVKFMQQGWSDNWGGADFPNGTGTNGGANIPVEQGTWTVIFNDVDGSYSFIAATAE